MKPHEKILKMIEEVDPNDTATLDEIDARVYLFVERPDVDPDMDVQGCGDIKKAWQAFSPKKYTRSRDALKAIRPRGWDFRSSYYYPNPDGEYGFVMTNNPENKINQYQVVGKSFASEELAELHAIIQAIAYERGE